MPTFEEDFGGPFDGFNHESKLTDGTFERRKREKEKAPKMDDLVKNNSQSLTEAASVKKTKITPETHVSSIFSLYNFFW